MGAGKIEIEWGAQLRSVGDGRTHLTMKAGRYGGFTTYHVGMEQWTRLMLAMIASLPDQAHPAQRFEYEPDYASAFLVLAGVSESPERAAASERRPGDHREIIRSLVTTMTDKRVHVDSIPPKVEANVRKHILPTAHQDDETVTLTVRGRGSVSLPADTHARDLVRIFDAIVSG